MLYNRKVRVAKWQYFTTDLCMRCDHKSVEHKATQKRGWNEKHSKKME